MKKYAFIVAPTASGFLVQIIRRRTSRGTTIERVQDGFVTQEEANAWGGKELAAYLAQRRAQREDRRARRVWGRLRKKEEAVWLEQQTYADLAECSLSPNPRANLARDTLRSRANLLWQDVAFRALKSGTSENDAIEMANKHVGRNWTQRFKKAQQGNLDILGRGVTELAVANAQRLLNISRVFESLGK